MVTGSPVMTVVIVGRDSPVLQQCYLSVALQSFRDYEVAVLDDASTKRNDMAQRAASVFGKRLSHVIVSDHRIGKVGLYADLLARLNPRTFVVNIDADDFLTRKDALELIWRTATQTKALCVFGLHRDLNGRSSTGKNTDAHIRSLLSGRSKLWFDHPHCAYADLLQKIPRERLLFEGQFPRALTDRFLFQHAMELSGPERVATTGQVIYEYRYPTKNSVSATLPLLRSRIGSFFFRQTPLPALPTGYIPGV